MRRGKVSGSSLHASAISCTTCRKRESSSDRAHSLRRGKVSGSSFHPRAIFCTATSCTAQLPHNRHNSLTRSRTLSATSAISFLFLTSETHSAAKNRLLNFADSPFSPIKYSRISPVNLASNIPAIKRNTSCQDSSRQCSR